ncbi:M23 family metallopeptidase [Nonomuraea bangladeshensis]|uniref:M23 family metallopeptidase n=1 Tax=Nonomuraea bangladeshensis TaxID=404385 RepID=UPI003C2F9206
MHFHSTIAQASLIHRPRTPSKTRLPRLHHTAASLLLLLLLPTALVAPLLATALIALTAPPARASPPAWRWPLDGHPRVLRRFTPPPERWLAGHRGVDLAAPPSTPVLAAGAGTVRFAGPVGGKGVVTIDHEGGLRTTYLPVIPTVKGGQPVTPGTELGLLQTPTPHCPESCLHWGLLRDSRYLNPLLLLGQAPIRLLPYWPAPPQAITLAKKPPSTTPPHPPARFRTRSKTDHPNPPPPETTQPNNYRLSKSTSPTTAATPIAISLPVAILVALLLIIGLHHRRHHGRTSNSRPPRPNSGQHRKRSWGNRGIRASTKHRKGPLTPPSP